MANSFVATASLDTTLPNRFHQLLPKLLMLGVVLLLLILAALAINVFNKLPNAAISLQHKGLNTQQTLQLQQLLGEKADTNLLKADLQSYVAKLETVDWVGQVDVRRDWQQGIVVNVVPRQAVAKFGSERLVDANGTVFKPADSNDLNNPSLMQLQGDSQNAVVMMQQIKQVSDWFMPLGMKIEEVIVTPRMAWLFRFDNGLRVLVDNDNTSEKLYRLSIMLQNQLKPQLKTLQTVDLRYKNGMAITKRPVIQQASDTTAVNKSADTKPVTDANSTSLKFGCPATLPVYPCSVTSSSVAKILSSATQNNLLAIALTTKALVAEITTTSCPACKCDWIALTAFGRTFGAISSCKYCSRHSCNWAKVCCFKKPATNSL